MLGKGFFDELRGSGFVGNIDYVTLEPGSVCRLRVLEGFPFGLIAIANSHTGAFFEKRRSYRFAQAAGATRDQNDAASESCAHEHTSEQASKLTYHQWP